MSFYTFYIHLAMIERSIIASLKTWQNKPDRKPLLLFGARQVGKTWVLRHFGETCFEYCAYFSLDEETHYAELFQRTKDPLRIIEQLSFLTEKPIRPQTTLIILDEIQACPEALASLKYFCEKAPEYAVACAGSMLGLAVGHEGVSFPVGKVDHLDMYPLTFSEFLLARESRLYDYFMSIDSLSPLPQLFFERLYEAFMAYRVCGGMPEAASAMLDGDIPRVEEKLSNILKDYSLDFIKHTTPVMANKVSHIWRSLPSQLAKENRKFIYQLVRPGARAREYEDALLWLKNAGLIYQVNLCREPRLPLAAYDDLSIFKVYANDIGLLRRLAGMEPSIYHAAADQFKEFRGALTENYILQSLIQQFGNPLRYWSSGNKAELEFLVQHENEIIPVDVKVGTSVTSKSLSEYNKTFLPTLRLRFSTRNLTLDDTLLNIPLFLADRTKDFIKIAVNDKQTP